MVERNCEVKIKIGLLLLYYYLFSFCSFCHINLDGSVLGIYNELAIIIMVIVQWFISRKISRRARADCWELAGWGEGECCCCWPVCDRSLFSNQPIGMADIIPNSKKCENSSTLFLLIRRNLAAKTTTKWWQTYHWTFLQIVTQRFLA